MVRLCLATLGIASVTLALACSVGLPDNADVPGRPTTPTSATADSSTALPPSGDSGTGVVPGTDAGTPLPPVCPPKVVGSVPPDWHPPPAIHRNACSTSQATTLTECLFSTAVPVATCDQFFNAAGNGNCISCAITSSIAPNHGAIVDDGTGYYANISGCVAALSGDSSQAGCGAKTEVFYDCLYAACQHCMNPFDYAACTDAAARGTCAAYAGPADCNKPYLDACTSATSPLDEAFKLVKLFCQP